MRVLVTIQFIVGIGYQKGDYARLHGNGGSGAVDWNTPVNNDVYDLFPDNAGFYGFGHAPFGHFRFGHAHSINTRVFGHLPFGHFPFGSGATLIKATAEIQSGCGEFEFAFACYDKLGNLHTGTPEEATVTIHMTPAAPVTGLKKNSYNKTTDVLVLDAA